MGAAARVIGCVDVTADGSSNSVEGSLVAFRNVTPQMLRRTSQRTWRHTFVGVQHKGAHMDPLDMEPRIRSVFRLIMTCYAYILLGVRRILALPAYTFETNDKQHFKVKCMLRLHTK